MDLCQELWQRVPLLPRLCNSGYADFSPEENIIVLKHQPTHPYLPNAYTTMTLIPTKTLTPTITPIAVPGCRNSGTFGGINNLLGIVANHHTPVRIQCLPAPTATLPIRLLQRQQPCVYFTNGGYCGSGSSRLCCSSDGLTCSGG